MCLGEIGRVRELRADARAVEGLGGMAGWEAVVDVGPRTLPVSLVTLDVPVAVGDWVVVHAGLALARLEEEQARTALALRSPAALEPMDADTGVPGTAARCCPQHDPHPYDSGVPGVGPHACGRTE